MVIFASNQKLCTLCGITYTDFRSNLRNFMTLMELQPFKEWDEDDTIWSWLVSESESEETWQEQSDVIYALIHYIEKKGKYWEDIVNVIKRNEDKFEREL